MDLKNQKRVKEAAEKYGLQDVMVILGTASTTDAANFAETVTDGDQSYTGPLARVSLGLSVYHILERQVKTALDPDAWQRHIAEHERRMDAANLAAVVARKRHLYGKELI